MAKKKKGIDAAKAHVDKYAASSPKDIPGFDTPADPPKLLPPANVGLRPDDRITWRFCHVDWASDWHWGNHPGGDDLRRTMQALGRMDGITFGDLWDAQLATKYLEHVPVERLSRAAQARWRAIESELSEGGVIFHFSVDPASLERVWAVNIVGCMHLIWWEANTPHQILLTKAQRDAGQR